MYHAILRKTTKNVFPSFYPQLLTIQHHNKFSSVSVQCSVCPNWKAFQVSTDLLQEFFRHLHLYDLICWMVISRCFSGPQWTLIRFPLSSVRQNPLTPSSSLQAGKQLCCPQSSPPLICQHSLNTNNKAHCIMQSQWKVHMSSSGLDPENVCWIEGSSQRNSISPSRVAVAGCLMHGHKGESVFIRLDPRTCLALCWLLLQHRTIEVHQGKCHCQC